VRGDSLRDLYAKALALLGLAVLAAAGALFDYWPITNEFPMVARIATPVVRDVPSVALTANAAAAMVAAAEPRDRARPAIAAPPPVAVPVALAISTSAYQMDLGTRAVFAPIDVAAAEEPALGAVSVSAPPQAVVVERMPTAGPGPGESADDGSAVGAVTDALKKTGQTIARTGARTGASIRDALVSFGGAFRKIL
jgi:hypothetical protein